MQHFILNQDLSPNRLTILDKGVLHQLRKVLRFQKDERCVLMDGQGLKAEAKVEALNAEVAIFSIEKREMFPAPKRKLRLVCALSKKPAIFELIVQKATELGTTDIIPLVTARCQIREWRKKDRLELIIKEACEQCERPYKPTLHTVSTLTEFLNAVPSGCLLAGDPWTYDLPLCKFSLSPREAVNLIIGPEGGLTDEELQNIRQKGGRLFLLGEGILRMETAAIASLAVIQYSRPI